MRCTLVVLLIVAVLASLTQAIFFPYRRSSYGGYGGYSGSGGQRTGRTYTDIAKFINGNPYVNPRGRPFPGQPFWPFG